MNILTLFVFVTEHPVFHSKYQKLKSKTNIKKYLSFTFSQFTWSKQKRLFWRTDFFPANQSF